jgi:hypothetical protein
VKQLTGKRRKLNLENHLAFGDFQKAFVEANRAVLQSFPDKKR